MDIPTLPQTSRILASAILSESPRSKRIFIDSGTTSHMTNNKDWSGADPGFKKMGGPIYLMYPCSVFEVREGRGCCMHVNPP